MFCKIFSDTFRGHWEVHCRCHSAQAGKANFQKTYCKTFGTSCRPRRMTRHSVKIKSRRVLEVGADREEQLGAVSHESHLFSRDAGDDASAVACGRCRSGQMPQYLYCIAGLREGGREKGGNKLLRSDVAGQSGAHREKGRGRGREEGMQRFFTANDDGGDGARRAASAPSFCPSVGASGNASFEEGSRFPSLPVPEMGAGNLI